MPRHRAWPRCRLRAPQSRHARADEGHDFRLRGGGPEADATGAVVTVNDRAAASGQLGLLVGLPPGRTFAAGTRQLVRVTFGVPSRPAVGSTAVGFEARPVVREVVGADANALPASSVGRNVTFAVGTPGPAVQFAGDAYSTSEADGAL